MILYAKTIKILHDQAQQVHCRDGSDMRIGRQLEFDWPFVIAFHLDS